MGQNSLEAIQDKGSRLLFRACRRRRGSRTSSALIDGVTFEFYDESIGIPEENEDRIFKPFYSTKKEAAGLGLSIVNSNVKANRGEVTFESRIDYGSTFIMWVPTDPRPKEPNDSAALDIKKQTQTTQEAVV